MRHKNLALFLLCLASFMAVVDTTIVSIALPSMRRELGFSGADAQWILNGYALAFGGLLLLLGRAGDLYGRRRLFVAGLALFAGASLAGGLSWEPWILVAARFLQGVGAAAFVPASLSLLTAIFAEGEERNRAIGVYGAMAALGFVVGMVGGGVITEFLGWRWVMFVNVPVALVALLPAPTVVPESRNERAPRSLDLAGALTVTVGLASLIYAISEVPDSGWASTTTLGFGTLGALLLVLFVVAERRSSAPLVPLGVLGERAVVAPNAAIFLQSMVGIAWLYVLTLHFQEVLGHGPLVAGLLFSPMTLASVVAAPVAGRLATKLGVKATASSGLALLAVGLLLMTPMSSRGGLVLVLCSMVIGEIGFMLSNVPLTIAGSGGTGERGLAAGLLNTSIQLGNAWGLGVVATVVAAVTTALGGEAVGPEALVGGLRSGLYACAGFALLALPIVLLFLRDENDPKEEEVASSMENIEVKSHHERPIPPGSVRELYDHVGWWRPGNEEDIAEVLEAGPAVGAWDGYRLVGFARALSDGHFAAYVEDVMVHEEYRGCGFGGRILTRLLEEIGEVGQVSLFCEPHTARLYEGHGFRAASKHVIMHRGEMET